MTSGGWSVVLMRVHVYSDGDGGRACPRHVGIRDQSSYNTVVYSVQWCRVYCGWVVVARVVVVVVDVVSVVMATAGLLPLWMLLKFESLPAIRGTPNCLPNSTMLMLPPSTRSRAMGLAALDPAICR